MNKEKIIKRRLKDAEKQVRLTHLNAALDLYESILRLDPEHEEAQMQRFKCLFNTRTPETLISEADNLIALFPHAANAWMSHALAYSQAGEYETAIVSYRKCIALEPDNFRAIHNLGALLAQNNDSTEGLSLLERAVELEPDYQIGYSTLMVAYQRLGRYADAIHAGERSPDIVSQQPGLQKMLADCYYQSGDYSRARTEFATMIQKIHANMPGDWMLCPIVTDEDEYDHQGGNAGADLDYIISTYYRAILSLDPLTSHDSESIKTVASDLTDILNLNPDHAYALAAMADLKRKEEKTREALEFIERAITLVPDDPELLRLKGFICMKQDPAEAEKIFDEVLRSIPEHQGALFGKAYTLKIQGMDDEALGVFTKLAERDPSFTTLLMGALNMDRVSKIGEGRGVRSASSPGLMSMSERETKSGKKQYLLD